MPNDDFDGIDWDHASLLRIANGITGNNGETPDDPDDDQDDGEHGPAPNRAAELAQQGQWLDSELDKAQKNGGGKTFVLSQVRRSLRKVAEQVEAAEQAGYERARTEFLGDPAQAREQLRQEMQDETARTRNLARLAVPEPLQDRFADVPAGDFKAFERRADQLRAAGVTWNGDPQLAQLAAQRLAAWQAQAAAAQEGGQPISLDPAGPVPEQVRDNVIRSQVEAMAAGQAGAQPPDSRSPLERIVQEAQRNPNLLASDEARDDLVGQFNRELDGLRQSIRGGSW